MLGARIFVAVCFLLLGASFVASTAILVNEFKESGDWVSMVMAHSHLYFFFPLFGILALSAFYLPSVVFTHLYWHHLPYGKLRYLFGLLVVAGLSYAVGVYLDAKPRAVWEISPRVLAADNGDPQNCGVPGRPACRRAPIIDTLMMAREAAQQRVGLSKFARNCRPDKLLEVPAEMLSQRYCFPAKGLLNATDCCQVQQRFADDVARLQANPAERSLSGKLDVIFLPLKIFFVLIVIAIGLLLAMWRDKIDEYYLRLVPAIERGVLIGAFAMLFWPMMDYGYQQTSNAMFGRWSGGPQFRLSLVIAPWALLLLFYFLRRLRKNLEIVGQLAGVTASAIAILRYEEINDWSVRLLGAGADRWTIAAMVIVTVIGFFLLLRPGRPVPTA